MENQVIDLTVFALKYRQALLFAMIEGLNEGSAFFFSDDRDPNKIELELAAAGLGGYRWEKASVTLKGNSAYLIERGSPVTAEESCCGCCCAQPKAQS